LSIATHEDYLRGVYDVLIRDKVVIVGCWGLAGLTSLSRCTAVCCGVLSCSGSCPRLLSLCRRASSV